MFTELNNHSYPKQIFYLTNRLTAMFITAFLSFTGGCVSGIVVELKNISAIGKEPLFIDRQAHVPLYTFKQVLDRLSNKYYS